MSQIIYVIRRAHDRKSYTEAVAYYAKESTAQAEAKMYNKDLENRNIDDVCYYVSPIALIEG